MKKVGVLGVGKSFMGNKFKNQNPLYIKPFIHMYTYYTCICTVSGPSISRI